jgi:zinc/manganese transport system substrate-binding protein
VATYSILGDWVQTIGGDQIALTVLVGPEGDAHTYEPTPRDSVALAEADILFENGLGFEVWLDRLFQASNSGARRVIVTEAIKPRELFVSDSRSEIDPHVWHLPENAILMVEAITLALEQADPGHTSEYRLRHTDYVAQLRDLDAWISREAASIPEPRRKLVTTHDTFGYLADAYNFEVLSVLGSVSSESSDPSAGQVAEIIDRIRILQIPAIFAENILNPKLTQKIAEEAGVKIVPTLYTDALGPAESPGGSYLGMMRYNVKTIVEALR